MRRRRRRQPKPTHQFRRTRTSPGKPQSWFHISCHREASSTSGAQSWLKAMSRRRWEKKRRRLKEEHALKNVASRSEQVLVVRQITSARMIWGKEVARKKPRRGGRILIMLMISLICLETLIAQNLGKIGAQLEVVGYRRNRFEVGDNSSASTLSENKGALVDRGPELRVAATKAQEDGKVEESTPTSSDNPPPQSAVRDSTSNGENSAPEDEAAEEDENEEAYENGEQTTRSAEGGGDDDYNDYGSYIIYAPDANQSELAAATTFFAASKRRLLQQPDKVRAEGSISIDHYSPSAGSAVSGAVSAGAAPASASASASASAQSSASGARTAKANETRPRRQQELDPDDVRWLSKMDERRRLVGDTSSSTRRPAPQTSKSEQEEDQEEDDGDDDGGEGEDEQVRQTNSRVLAPQAQGLDKQTKEEFEATNLEANGDTSARSGATHNVYYWRLVWAVLPVGATFGNLLVILAVYNERSLQSVTNYFIVSLAFADLFVGIVVMPFAVYVLVNDVWELSDAICDMYVAVDVTSSTASILNLVAISIDRYRAVAHPIAYSARSSSTRAILTIFLVWLISCCVGAPIILGLNTSPERQPSLCILYNSTFIFWSSLTSFYVPCIIMIGLYWRIFLAIRSRTKKAIGANHCSTGTAAGGQTLTLGGSAGSCTTPASLIPNQALASTNQTTPPAQTQTEAKAQGDNKIAPLDRSTLTCPSAKGESSGNGSGSGQGDYLRAMAQRLIATKPDTQSPQRVRRQEPRKLECAHLSRLLKEEQKTKTLSRVDLENDECCASSDSDKSSRSSSLSKSSFKLSHRRSSGAKSLSSEPDYDDDDDEEEDEDEEHSRHSSRASSSTRPSCCQGSPINCATCERLLMATSCSLMPAISSSRNITELFLTDTNLAPSGASGKPLVTNSSNVDLQSASTELHSCNIVGEIRGAHSHCGTGGSDLSANWWTNSGATHCECSLNEEDCFRSNHQRGHQMACQSHLQTVCQSEIQCSRGRREEESPNKTTRSALELNKSCCPNNNQQGGGILLSATEKLKRRSIKLGKLIRGAKEVRAGAGKAEQGGSNLEHANVMGATSTFQDSSTLAGISSSSSLLYNGNKRASIQKHLENLPEPNHHHALPLSIDSPDLGAKKGDLARENRKSSLNRLPNAAETREGVRTGGGGGGIVATLLDHLMSQQQVHEKQQKHLLGQHQKKQLLESGTGADSNARHRAGSRRRREKNAARRERKATKTLAIVLGIFLICWTPFFTCNIIDGFCIQLEMDCRPGMMVYLVTSWLGYINSCVNPIIYTIFNMEFRRAFKKILTPGESCCIGGKS